MVVDYPTISELATAEYVLDVLRDTHRHVANNETSADSRFILNFDTSIDEWQEAMGDWISWRDLGHWMNELWDIQLTDDIWQHVLVPGSKKRLGALCEVIAQHARQPQIRPARFLGTNCSTAGAFLTIRSILKQAGADISLIAPSTPLKPYTREYYPQLLRHISLLPPGALPTVKVHSHPFINITVWGMLLGLLFLVLGSCFAGQYHLFTFIGGCLLFICFPLNQLGYPRFLPTSVEFGELKTFRDLAKVIAKGQFSRVAVAH